MTTRTPPSRATKLGRTAFAASLALATAACGTADDIAANSEERVETQVEDLIDDTMDDTIDEGLNEIEVPDSLPLIDEQPAPAAVEAPDAEAPAAEAPAAEAPAADAEESPAVPVAPVPTPDAPAPENSDRPAPSDPAPSPAPSGSALDAAEAESLRLLNDLRAEQGLATLSANSEMNKFARDWSQAMAAGEFEHSDGPYGENIAWTSRASASAAEAAQQLHNNWVDSPGHYANMTNSNYVEVGVGFHQGPDGWHATHVFK